MIVLTAVLDLRGAIGFSGVTILTYYAITNAACLTLDQGQRRSPRWLSIAGLLGCVVLAVMLPLAAIVTGAGVLLVPAPSSAASHLHHTVTRHHATVESPGTTRRWWRNHRVALQSRLSCCGSAADVKEWGDAGLGHSGRRGGARSRRGRAGRGGRRGAVRELRCRLEAMRPADNDGPQTEVNCAKPGPCVATANDGDVSQLTFRAGADFKQKIEISPISTGPGECARH